jgi:hypothetical protein
VASGKPAGNQAAGKVSTMTTAIATANTANAGSNLVLPVGRPEIQYVSFRVRHAATFY